MIDDLVEKLKSLHFNEPDNENLRKNAEKARKKIKENEERMKRAGHVSMETLFREFTI